jgi:hypothetical protein
MFTAEIELQDSRTPLFVVGLRTDLWYAHIRDNMSFRDAKKLAKETADHWEVDVSIGANVLQWLNDLAAEALSSGDPKKQAWGQEMRETIDAKRYTPAINAAGRARYIKK